MRSFNYNPSNDLASMHGGSYGKVYTWAPATQFFRTESLCAGPHPICLCRTSRLRLDDRAELAFRKRLPADDHFLYGKSDKHKFRDRQHTKLGGSRSDEYCHHAGDIHVPIGKRFNEHEPNRDDHLHADGKQYRWLDHIHANRYR